jgi:zinc-ribbon domain
MARAVSCPRCNKRLPEEAQFCRRCGTGLRGQSAGPVVRPPLVAMGYDSPLSPWEGASPADASSVLGYEPRGKRRPKRPKAVPPPATAFLGKGWWLVLLIGFLAFRACSSFHTSHRRSEPRYFQPAPPPIRVTPQDRRVPPAQEGRSSAEEYESQGTAPTERGDQFTSP